jgi:hypothetical protein
MTFIALAYAAIALWTAYQLLPPVLLALRTGVWKARGNNHYYKNQQPVLFWLGVLFTSLLICIAIGGSLMLIFGIVLGAPQPA